MKKSLLLTLIAVLTNSFFQAQCEDGRYRNFIFSAVEVESDVQYGSNIDFMGTSQDLFLDVYQPAGDTETARPLIIVSHGGSFVGGNKTGDDVVPFCQDMAKMGYVVASIQYRLGLPFDIEAVVESFAEAILRGTHDSRGAVRFFRKNAAEGGNTYGIDPDKIFMAGSSAGGFNALHLAYMDTEEEISLYVDQNQPGLGGGVEGETGNLGYSSDVTAIINICGALANPEFMQEDDTPVCSFHGTGDTTVPFGTDMITAFGLLDVDTVHGSATIDARAEELGLEHCFFVQWLEGHTAHTNNAMHYDTLRSISSNFLSHFVCSDVELDCDYRELEVVSSLNDVDADQAAVWPNPANKELNIQNGHGRSSKYVILDLTGQEVKRGEVSESMTTVSLSGLQNGLYLLQLNDHLGVRTIRFHKSGN